MSFSRRALLTSFLATVAPVLQARATVPKADMEYNGPDDPMAYKSFFVEKAKEGHGLITHVFHASWCAPCKILFGQLDELRQKPGIKFTTVGLDIDKYPKIVEGIPLESRYKNPPLLMNYFKGQVVTNFTHQGTLPVDHPNRMERLENYWRGLSAQAYPAVSSAAPSLKP